MIDITSPKHVIIPALYNLTSTVTPFCQFEHYQYFVHDFEEICNLFTFKEEILHKANVSLSSTLNNIIRSNVALVGIHVRRGNRRFKTNLAPQDYFTKAMDYFRQKYHNVHFVVASIDRMWVKEKLCPFSNVTLLPAGSSAATDMAALTLCDHVIMSVGTFGFWAGLLAGGEVIYFNGNDQVNYFPPHWIPMT